MSKGTVSFLGTAVSAVKPAEPPCMDDPQFSLADFSRYKRTGTDVCSHRTNIAVHGRTGRLDLLFTVNMLARSVNEWNKASGKRLARVNSYTDQTKHQRQCCCETNTRTAASIGFFYNDFCRIANQLQAVFFFYAFLDHKHMFQYPGCAKCTHQCLTAAPNQKYGFWTRL